MPDDRVNVYVADQARLAGEVASNDAVKGRQAARQALDHRIGRGEINLGLAENRELRKDRYPAQLLPGDTGR